MSPKTRKRPEAEASSDEASSWKIGQAFGGMGQRNTSSGAQNPGEKSKITQQARRADEKDLIRLLEKRHARSQALAHLVSKSAQNFDYIVEFRADVLSDPDHPEGILLKPEEIEGWIIRKAAEEGFSWWAQAAVPDSAELRACIKRDDEWELDIMDRPSRFVIPPKQATEVCCRSLAYEVNGEAKEVRTAAGGVLERLRLCSERVARTVGCTPAEAATFILSDQLIPVPTWREAFAMHSDHAGLSRVILALDPTLLPTEVAAIWKRLHNELFPQTGRDRYHALSARSLVLAVFMWTRPKGEKLRESMARWNKQFPRWRYKKVSNFFNARDDAWRLAGETLDKPARKTVKEKA